MSYENHVWNVAKGVGTGQAGQTYHAYIKFYNRAATGVRLDIRVILCTIFDRRRGLEGVLVVWRFFSSRWLLHAWPWHLFSEDLSEPVFCINDTS